jgi:hypothetical protein
MDLDTFVSSLKPFTKVMMIGIAVTAGLITLNIISPIHVVMLFPDQFFHVGSPVLEVPDHPPLQRGVQHGPAFRAHFLVS